MKVRLTEKDYMGETGVMVYATEEPNEEAAMAFKILDHFALIAALPDGEDSAGRAKLALISPQEAVRRAFDLAQEAFRVARERGLMVQLPDLNEINAEHDANRATERQERIEEKRKERERRQKREAATSN